MHRSPRPYIDGGVALTRFAGINPKRIQESEYKNSEKVFAYGAIGNY